MTVQPIEDADLLWRRISRDKLDKNTGGILKRAYILPNKNSDTPDPSISVYSARLLSEPAQVATGINNKRQGVGQLLAGDVRSLEWENTRVFSIWHRPNSISDIGHAHCEIEGATLLSHCELLARITTLILPPPQN